MSTGQGPTFGLCGTFHGRNKQDGLKWLDRFEYEHLLHLPSGAPIPPETYHRTVWMLLEGDAEAWFMQFPYMKDLILKDVWKERDVVRFRQSFLMEFMAYEPTSAILYQTDQRALDGLVWKKDESLYHFYHCCLSVLRQMGGRDKPSVPSPNIRDLSTFENIFLAKVKAQFVKGIRLPAMQSVIIPTEEESLYNLYNRTERRFVDWSKNDTVQAYPGLKLNELRKLKWNTFATKWRRDGEEVCSLLNVLDALETDRYRSLASYRWFLEDASNRKRNRERLA